MNEPLTFSTGCAIDQYCFCIAGMLDELDHWDDFTKMMTYDHRSRKWLSYDLEDWKMVSIANNKKEEMLLGLDLYGRLERSTLATREYEYVVEDSELNKIRIISQTLYVCGSDGQVYQYKDAKWRNIGQNLYEKKEITKEELLSLEIPVYLEKYLIDINGFSENDIYVCGTDKGEGFLAFFDGNTWITINKITPSSLNHIFLCPNNKDVIISGDYGTLLQGNIHSGFKNLKNMTINSAFYSSDFYQDTLYIASEDGLYTYKDNVFKKVKEVENIKATFHVEEKDGVLWVLAEKLLIRFDGKHWEIIEHPDNTNDTEERSETLKCYAGERCPQSGNWYSHANQMQKRYFSEGEIMPEIENNAWGKTIWYMDI